MRVDLKHLVAKGQARKLVDKVMAYAKLMQSQGKPVDRIIVSAVQYEMLRKLASSYGRVVLCCGDALVYYNHDPIDESEPVYEPKPRFDAGLPPVTVNPFGNAAKFVHVNDIPHGTPVHFGTVNGFNNHSDGPPADDFDNAAWSGFDDDDIPF